VKCRGVADECHVLCFFNEVVKVLFLVVRDQIIFVEAWLKKGVGLRFDFRFYLIRDVEDLEV
jgi:hypothetical protein